MTFRALTSTADGRLSAGRLYEGMYTVVRDQRTPQGTIPGGPRVLVQDNTGQRMTFNPKVFIEVR